MSEFISEGMIDARTIFAGSERASMKMGGCEEIWKALLMLPFRREVETFFWDWHTIPLAKNEKDPEERKNRKRGKHS